LPAVDEIGRPESVLYEVGQRTFFVYILASRLRTLYVGVTGDLHRRLAQHRSAQHGFTRRYGIVRLVHMEVYPTAASAIARERQLKGWRRERKIALIESTNPGWSDLLEETSD
jgi:putative endonuclease